MKGLTAKEARDAALHIKESFREKVFQDYDALLDESVEYAIGKIDSDIVKAVRNSKFNVQTNLNTYTTKEDLGGLIADEEYSALITAVAEKVCKHFEGLGYRIDYEHTGKVYTYLTFSTSFDGEAIS